MHKLEITLKQHTPLIHFQHDQEGATLRASEVKPKLDKFIKTALKKLCPEIFDKYKPLIDKIPDEHNKVNSPYKLSIRLKDEKAIDKYVIGSYIPKNKSENYQKQGYRILNKAPYFADNKMIKDGLTGEDDYKLGIMLKKNNTLDLIFRFWDPEWKEFLQSIIPLFFAVTNFGTREDKGFGCFYPVDKDRTDLESTLRLFSGKALYCSIGSFGITETFKEIDAIYKKMKSGDQRTDSELRKHFNSMRPMIEWEKPEIQEQIGKISKQSISSKTNKRQFVRALLGLPEIYEYPKCDSKVLVSYKCEGETDKEKKIEGKEGKEGKEKKIARYASPVSFKVFDGYIYLYVSQQESMITNQTFEFEIQGTETKFSLTTPEAFNVIDFLNIAMKHQKKWIKIDKQ
ncbi:MAG: hypothetical protein LBS55_06410 [Prevotellaceae bacterium]|jgi:hypothetical protein|nr:hypothetical protein [Prevotellaceae bacterium]